MTLKATEVRQRIDELLKEECGRTHEAPLASGLLDSLRAVEFALRLEAEFDLPPSELTLTDLSSVDALANKVVALARRAG